MVFFNEAGLGDSTKWTIHRPGSLNPTDYATSYLRRTLYDAVFVLHVFRSSNNHGASR